MEDRPPIWTVAAKKFNKLSPQPTRGDPSAWGLDEVLTNPHRKNVSCYLPFARNASDLD